MWLKCLSLITLFCLLLGCNSTDDNDEKVKAATVEELNVKAPDQQEIEKTLKALHAEKPASYRITSGDKFDLSVYDNNDLNIKGMLVMPDGTVSVSLIGVIKIGGLTISEAAALIEKRLKKYLVHPKVTLIPTAIKSSTFTIVGKVGNPDVYPIKGQTKLTDAVALAKGFAVGEFHGDTVEMADLEHAFIARNGQILPVNFIKAIRQGDALHNIPLKNGDYIYIPSSMNKEVFVLGDVKSPGYLGYKEGLTLMQAITYAKGRLNSSAFDAVIIRGNLTKPKVFKVYMEDILRGKTADFPLKPSDIVYVPKGAFSEYNVVVEKLMPTFELLNLMAGPFGNTALTLPSSGSGSSGGN